jgi:hypothetical protein
VESKVPVHMVHVTILVLVLKKTYLMEPVVAMDVVSTVVSEELVLPQTYNFQLAQIVLGRLAAPAFVRRQENMTKRFLRKELIVERRMVIAVESIVMVKEIVQSGMMHPELFVEQEKVRAKSRVNVMVLDPALGVRSVMKVNRAVLMADALAVLVFAIWVPETWARTVASYIFTK